VYVAFNSVRCHTIDRNTRHDDMQTGIQCTLFLFKTTEHSSDDGSKHATPHINYNCIGGGGGGECADCRVEFGYDVIKETEYFVSL
jgi:hypothetical protein